MKQRTDTEKISQFLGRIRTGSSYLKLKTGLARDNLFVSSASRFCELNKPCSGFFKFAFEIKLC